MNKTIERLEKLAMQATVENSHYYVKSVCVDTVDDIKLLIAQIILLSNTLEFYANTDNWTNSGNEKINRMPYTDVSIMTIECKGKWITDAEVAGKRARQALEKIKNQWKVTWK